jgi:hypothetical protein
MKAVPYCDVCEKDHADDPGLVLARWQHMDICLDCLEACPGQEAYRDAEACPAPRCSR